MTYTELVAGPDALYGAGAVNMHLSTKGISAAVAYAASLHKPTVLWIHESAQIAWHLPKSHADLGRVLEMPADAKSSPGWLRMSRDLHVALPLYSGDFSGTSAPSELVRALTLFRDHAGLQFMFSAPATALQLVAMKYTGRRPSSPSGVPYTGSAFAIPAHAWLRTPDSDDWAMPAVQLFDRRGSYLAAWRGVELPDGEWITMVEPFPIAAADAVGYYLVDLRPLRRWLDAQRLYDPFARARGEEAGGPCWITAPLARLAGELAEQAGAALYVERAVISERRVRALDHAGGRLADARKALEAADDRVAPIVLAVIKDAYTRGTAHLEYGRRPPHPLARPEWRHTIVDRSVANTYRSLLRAGRRPLVVGGIDAAVFPVTSDWIHVPGLADGPELGSWRARGAPMKSSTALRRLAVTTKDTGTKARELIAALMAS